MRSVSVSNTVKGNTMSRFTNKLCPVCRERFREGDDIAVCPECGTPHHRECFLKNKKCGVEEFHAEGFTWNGRLPDEPEPSGAERPASSEIPADAEIRSVVPEPVDIKTNNLDDDNAANVSDNGGKGENGSSQGGNEDQTGIPGFPDPSIDPFGDPNIDDPLKELYRMANDNSIGEDGVSMQELIAYTGSSIWHYSRAFSTFRGNAAEGGKKHYISFNICSGLFEPIYQFYKKIPILGVILLLISVLPAFIIVLSTDSAAAAQDLALKSSWLVSMINIAKTVLLCLFGDYIFYRHAVRKIKKVRQSFEGDTNTVEYFQTLSDSGRPSFAQAILGCLAFMFANACVVVLSGGLF